MDVKEAYQFTISLRKIEPPIWRRIQVPASFTLAALHRVLQIVMGWQNCHLHSFNVGNEEYGVPSPEYDDFEMKMLDEKKMTLKKVIALSVREFTYEYDPGDSWQHSITLEKALEPDDTFHLPICLAGQRACPPEDCGGVPGYEAFLEALGDKDHEEHDDMKRWIGGYFDPESFDSNSVNRALRDIR